MTPAPATSAASTGRTPRRRSTTPWPVILTFLAPALLLYVGFTIYPAVRTFYNSVHTIKPRGVVVYVGLENFRELLGADPVFWKAVRNTMLWAVVAPIPDVLIGLLLALCLYAKVPLARFFRVVWFTPVLLSYVVVGIIWMWVYNSVGRGLHLPDPRASPTVVQVLPPRGGRAFTHVWVGPTVVRLALRLPTRSRRRPPSTADGPLARLRLDDVAYAPEPPRAVLHRQGRVSMV
jgi:ABC-type Fe3+ transport system permease subunit